MSMLTFFESRLYALNTNLWKYQWESAIFSNFKLEIIYLFLKVTVIQPELFIEKIDTIIVVKFHYNLYSWSNHIQLKYLYDLTGMNLIHDNMYWIHNNYQLK